MSPHKAAVCKTLSPAGQRVFPLVEFDEDEQMLTEVRKHVIGLIFIWLTGLFITAVIVIAISWFAMSLDGLGFEIDNGETIKAILVGIALLLGVLSLVATLITSLIYRSNVVFVTNEKIAEVLYMSIFNRRVKQLGIGNVEDVTVIQKGILPRIFNYGSLVVQTAGEAENPTFTYVPRPDYVSRIMIEAHEHYVQQYGN